VAQREPGDGFRRLICCDLCVRLILFQCELSKKRCYPICFFDDLEELVEVRPEGIFQRGVVDDFF